MPDPSPLTLDALNAMPALDFVAGLGDVFEHSPWVVEQAAAGRPFASVQALHDACMAGVRRADADTKLALIRAHPELAGREAADDTLTADSTGEQGRLGINRLNAAEHAELAALNAAYRARFGFPCIIALCRHTERATVLATFRNRVASTTASEIAANLAEIGHITAARLVARLHRTGLGH